MNNAKFIEGIDMIVAGLEVLKNSVNDELMASAVVVEEPKKETKKAAKKKTPKVETVETPVVEENNEGTVVTAEELAELDLQSLKAIANAVNVEVKKNDNAKSLIKRILATDMDTLVSALTELGFYETEDVDDVVVEEEEETEDEDESIEAQLNAMTQEDLADILTEAGLSIKGKKQALIDRILKGIEDGVISLEEENESEEEAEEGEVSEELDIEEIINELDDEQIKEVAEALEIETTITKKVSGKNKKVAVSLDDLKAQIIAHENVIDTLVEMGLVEGEESEEETEEEEEFEASEERLAAEAKIEEDIKKAYKAKKLKDSEIEKFNKAYFEGDPDCAKGCKGCKGEDKLECYINIKKMFVDDEGNVIGNKEAYIRNDSNYCCGKELVENGDTFSCSVCGEEYAG